MNKSTRHIMQNVATIIKSLIIHSIIANYKDLSNTNTSQLRFHPDLMVYFLFTALLKLVVSFFFLYTKILCLHRAVNNSRFNVQNLDLKLLEN